MYDDGASAAASDFQVPYLRHMLHFLGLENLTVIAADKQGFGEEVAQHSVDDAIAKALDAGGDNSMPQLRVAA